jgi:hypothetical protein
LPASDADIEALTTAIWIARELKVETVEVLDNAIRLGWLGNRRPPLLHGPSLHRLGSRLPVLARDVQNRLVIEGPLLAAAVGGDPTDRRPGLRQDAVLSVQTLQRSLLKVRMHFDPIDDGHDGNVSYQALEVLGHEVADADGADLSLCEQLLERPGRRPRSDRGGSAPADGGAADRSTHGDPMINSQSRSG